MGEYIKDANTISLLHFNNGLQDESGKVWAAVNGAATSTAQSKFGGGALHLDRASGLQYLTTPRSDDFNFGTGDFTIDWWEYRSATPSKAGAVFTTDYSAPQGAVTAIVAGYASPGVPVLYCSFTGDKWDVAGKPIGQFKLNIWTHFAVVRSGNNWYSFQDGKQTNSWTLSGMFTGTNIEKPSIGMYSGVIVNGYIDELRISNVARWTSEFDPGEGPTTPTPAPKDLTASADDTKVTLSWIAVTDATGYNVKRSTTAGGPYTTIASNVAGISYVDTDVANGTTYYYVVTAVGPNGESVNSNEASATPMASEKVILAVNMNDGRHEYQMTKAEVDAFIAWYDAKAGGTGSNYYVINKIFNIGPFTTRKDYLVFDEIINFEVMAY